MWASNDVCFLPDRGSRLLFVTLWPLDKCQADDNSLGRRQVTLRHWRCLHAGSQIGSGPYQWWPLVRSLPRKNSLGQALIPLLPVRALVTVSIMFRGFPWILPGSVVSSRSQPFPDFLVIYSHPFLWFGLHSDGTEFDPNYLPKKTTPLEHVSLMSMYQMNGHHYKQWLLVSFHLLFDRTVFLLAVGMYWYTKLAVRILLFSDNNLATHRVLN